MDLSGYEIFGCWLLAAGCWLLAAGCWLLGSYILFLVREKGHRDDGSPLFLFLPTIMLASLILFSHRYAVVSVSRWVSDGKDSTHDDLRSANF